MAGMIKVSQMNDLSFCSSKSLDDINCNFTASEEKSDFKKNLTDSLSVNNLGKLSLIGLGLTEINVNFHELLNVTEIDLSQNELLSLPDSIINCKKVTSLNLSKNKFSVPPKCIYFGLHFVRKLDLSYNELSQFHMAPLCLPFLISLNLKCNFLKSPPSWLQQDLPCSLEQLDLSFNPCFTSKLSDTFFKFSVESVMANIRTLKVSNTRLSSINFDFIKNFVNLSCLDIGNSNIKPRNHQEEWNRFQELNENVLNELPLEELNAVDCGIADLPGNIDKMIHLKVLNISDNRILWLPERFSYLHSLVIFEASHCNLVLLPSDIGRLVSLQQLWLSCNDLSSLPESIQSLTSLEILDLYDNSFTSLPNILNFPNLKGFDICMNICDPSSFKMSDNNYNYEKLRDYLRSTLKYFEDRALGMKIINYNSESDNDSKFESESSSVLSGPPPFHRTRRSSYDDDYDDIDEAEMWDLEVDENEVFDPNEFVGHMLRKSQSSDSLLKLKKNMAEQEEHFFCPYQQVSNFYGSLIRDNYDEEEEGQFNDE